MRSPADAASPRTLSPALCLFLGVLALRLIVLLRLSGSQFLLPATGDMQFYNEWALRVLNGTLVEPKAFYGLPLYPYLLAAIYKVCGYNPFVPGFLQALCEGGTAVLLYKLGVFVFSSDARVSFAERELPQSLLSKRASFIGIAAGIGWAFFEPAESYSVVLMPTSWLVFIFWFVVWQIVKRSALPSWWILLLLGVLIGFTAMGVATILFLLPLLLVAIFVRWKARFYRGLVGAMLVIAGVFLGASPAWMHNCFVARDPVFLSAHSGVNFWIGNNPTANGYPKFPPGLHASQRAMLQDSITTAEEAAGRPLKRSEISAFWSAKARSWIRQHPVEWLQLIALKTKNFWNAFQYDDLSIVTAFREEQVILPGLSFGLVGALGLAGLLLACWKYPTSRWIAAAVFLHMISLLTVFVTARYRLAAVPGLLLFGACGLWELGRYFACANYRAAAFFLAVLFGSTAFVSLPQREPTLWALDDYNSGLHALDIGNLKRAERKLDRAYAYSPNNAEVNFAEGNLQLALGHQKSAQAFYVATLRLDPLHGGAFNNLGVTILAEGNSAVAAKLFRRALEQNPNDAKIYYLLARAELLNKNLPQARTEIARALQLDPGRSEYLQLQATIDSTLP